MQAAHNTNQAAMRAMRGAVATADGKRRSISLICRGNRQADEILHAIWPDCLYAAAINIAKPTKQGGRK